MRKPASLLFAVLVLPFTVTAQEAVRFDLVKTNAMPLIGYYYPLPLELSAAKPATLTRAPKNLKAPLYGILPVASDGGRKFHVILDEPDSADAGLYVDSNGDGDMTNDPAAEWTSSRNAEGLTNFNGGATIALAAGAKVIDVHLGMYRFDKRDPGRQNLKNTLLYYRDYAYQGQITFGGKSYRAYLSDERARGDFRSADVRLLVDLNGDSRLTTPRESFDAAGPFNIGGTTYEIADMARLGDSFRIVKSSKTVAETLPPPDHAVGRAITGFQAMDMDGRSVRFPADFAGKIVMLDFWATWCAPCVEEVPGLVSAYAKYKAKGFEVLGISLDSASQADKVRSVTRDKGMSWRQVYDGKGWSADIAQLYLVTSIPAAYLVDGDTGEILAVEDSLRGDALARTVEQSLRKKGKL